MTFFEHLSGLRINYHKSELTVINLDEREVIDFAKKYSAVKWVVFLLSI
jgi:hypothetical protein